MKGEIQEDQQTLLINLNTTAEYRGNTWGSLLWYPLMVVVGYVFG